MFVAGNIAFFAAQTGGISPLGVGQKVHLGIEFPGGFRIKTLVPVEGAIPPIKRNNADQIYTDEAGAKIVFIDISGIAFEKMTLVRGKDDDGWGAYWFLTEMPTKGEPVSYAGTQTDRKEIYNAGAGTTTSEISIPDDAKVLAFYYSDPKSGGGEYVYCPQAITFINTDATTPAN